MLRQQKETIVNEMRGNLEKAAGVLFVDYTGLTVEEANDLRGKYRQAGVHYQVFKNTLMTRALAGLPFEDASKCLKGTPTGVVIGWEDPVTPAKITYEFKKTCDHIAVKGGVVDAKAIDVSGAEALSKMPTKDELMGQLMAQILSPATNLAGQLKGPGGKVAGAIEALADKLEGEAA